MTIYDVQNAKKAPIWKQRIIECRSSGKSVKEWCKEHGLDFTTYYCKFRSTGTHIPKSAVRAFRTNRYKYFG